MEDYEHYEGDPNTEEARDTEQEARDRDNREAVARMRSQRVAGRAPYGKIPDAAEENRKAYSEHETGTVTPADVDYNIEEDPDAWEGAVNATRVRSEDPHAVGEGFGDPEYFDDDEEADEE